MRGPTTIDAWTGGSGAWTDAANWSLGIPGPADSASFGGTGAFAVTFATTDTIDALLDPANPAATIELAAGTLSLLDGGDWSGVVLLEPSAEIGLGAAALTLSGAAVLDGTIAGTGTLTLSGSADADQLLLTGGAVLQDLGTITADGAITLGTAAANAATLTVAAGATFDILDDASMIASGSATIANAGLFLKSGVSGTSLIGASFVNSGTIAVGRGTLGLDGGTDRLGGAIDGGGELDLRGGGAYALAPGVALAVGTLAILDSATAVTLDTSPAYAGAFTLGDSARLDLNGNAFSLSGGNDALLGTIAGPGNVTIAGTADAGGLVVAGGAALLDTGEMTQDGVVNLGTGGADFNALSIAAGATYDLLGDFSINAFGSASIVNSGLFEKTGVSGVSSIGAGFANSGTVAASAGTLGFAGTLTNDGTIAVGGAGAIAELMLAAPLAADAGHSGTVSIGAGGTASLGAVAADQGIAFADADAVLALAQPESVVAAISGFTTGDTIDLVGIAANGLTYASATGLLTVSETANGTLASVATLDLPGIADPSALALVVDGTGGTAIELAHTGPQFTNPPGTIVADDWTAAGGGDWSNAANWIAHAVPGAGNDAVIAPAATAGFTLGYDATDTINQLSGGTVSGGAAITLAIAGGALTVNDGGSWAGPIAQSAGTLDAVTGLIVAGSLSLGAAALDEVDSGALSIGDAALAGTVAGAGELYVNGSGGVTLEPGVAITAATFDLGVDAGQGAAATLDTALTYAGDFILAATGGAGASLLLNGNSLLLAGVAALDGSATGPGTLAIGGTADLDGFALSGSALLLDGGTVTQDGAVTLGAGRSDASGLTIGAGATYGILADVNILSGGGATIDNAGLLQKTGVSGATTIAADVDSIGTMLVKRGTLALAGSTDTLGGTLAGAGDIVVSAAGGATLASGIVLTVASLGLFGGGTIAFGGNETYAGTFTLGASTALSLNGVTLTLSGAAALDGQVGNAGTITATGSADANGLALSGTTALTDTGTITQDGNISLGTAGTDAVSLSIGSGATYDILADVNLNSFGNPTVSNAGLFEKSGVSGTSYVFANMTNTGTIKVERGVLSLRAGVASLGGTVAGAGEFDLNSAGDYTLASNLVLNVASLGLFGSADIALGGSRAYGGAFTLGAGTTLGLGGNALTLTGTGALDGLIQGPGSATIAGSADASGLVVYGAAALNVTGTLTADGSLTLGSGADTALLNIGAGGTYDLIADVDLDLNGNAIVNNAGLFEKTALGGISNVQVNVDNTGTIAIASGTLAFGGSLANDGLMRIAGGELVVAQSLVADSGRSGTVSIGAAGEALLEGAVSSAQAITFATATGGLALTQPTRIGGTISGFQAGDSIDLIGATFTQGADTVSFVGGVLTISDPGTTIASLHLAGSYTADEFQLAGDGAGGTDILTTNVPCFLAGTRILTPAGEVPVEALRVGDDVLTAGGEARPIVWIGQRRIACARHPRPHKVLPVRVAAGAFGTDLPRRDLLLSPDHAVYAEGVLIPVKHLVNAITVRQETVAAAHYFHIELPAHAVLLAEGLAVESYLDGGNRGEFATGARPSTLHPDFAAPRFMRPCAPLCVSGRPLAEVKRALLRRVEHLGHRAIAEPDLCLVAAGRMIRAAGIDGGMHRFILPERAREVCIVSRSGVPAELEAESEDRRRLGVAVQAILLDGRPVPLDDAMLGPGFYAPERAGGEVWRWTDGRAWLALPPGPGGRQPRLLELLPRAAMRSWAAAASPAARAA